MTEKITDFNEEGIYFLPLGGADEIGMNMYVYAVDGKMIVVDAGYGFLLDEYPGMDLAYASPEFLDDYKDKIEGLFITHGHEDHMGAIGQIWPHLQCPVYGTDFSLGLIRERLHEFKLDDKVPLISVNNNRKVKLPSFEVEFISVAHSIPQTSALAIRTKYGNVLHASDWRFDDDKLSSLPTDYESLRKLATEGVDMFVCDSTNVMLNQKLPTEAEVREHMLELIPQIKGGLIVTCFATNLMRLESLLLAAKKANRVPVLLGRSLETTVRIARSCGYLQNLPQTHTMEEAKDVPSDMAMYICTGSQANYRSALTVIANGENKYLKIDDSDTVIFSSKMIPGNETKIERMQEKMIDSGATIITDEDELVHASGHADKNDLRRMYEMIKPAVVFPVHGDKKFIREHKRFALSCGIKEVFSAKNGDLCLLKDKHIKCIGQVHADIIAWDRNHPVSLGDQVIKNRRRIAFNCTMFISVLVKNMKLADIKLTSIDILPEKDWDELADKILEKVRPLIEKKLSECENKIQIEDFIRGQIRRRVFAATEIKPVTFLHVFYDND